MGLAALPKKKAAEVKKALAKSPGLKFDEGKPPLSLLSRVWLEGTA